MALCESQLEALHQIKTEEGDQVDQDKKPSIMPHSNAMTPPMTLPIAVDYRSPRSHFIPPEVEMYAQQSQPILAPRPITPSSPDSNTTAGSSTPVAPAKRKRGRPKVDKTSPEYLAKHAAKKQAKEMAAMAVMDGETVKRKRGRPRVDKTSPEYIARKKAKEIEVLEKRAKRQYKRRATAAKLPAITVPVTRRKSATAMPIVRKALVPTPKRVGAKSKKLAPSAKDRKVVVRRTTTNFVKKVRKKDSGASSSTSEMTPRVKRKYTKRAPAAASHSTEPKKRGRKKKILMGPDGEPLQATSSAEKPKKRGRRRKSQLIAAGLLPASTNATPNKKRSQARHLVPINSEPISLDSDDENMGSPNSDLSFDENLRALRHLHEKYANIGKDDLYEAHLLAANFKKPAADAANSGAAANSAAVNSAAAKGGANSASRRSASVESVKDENEGKVEKLEDSSNSDSDSSSSGSGSGGSSSSNSGSSSGSGSSSDSDSSDSEPEVEKNGVQPVKSRTPTPRQDKDGEASNSVNAWAGAAAGTGTDSHSGSGSDSDPERSRTPGVEEPSQSLSESENESPDKPFQCNVCHKWYSTMVTLKIHKRGHISRGGSARRSRSRALDRYECDCCLTTFSRREKLLEHKAEAHRGSMTVRCEVCRRCFEDDAELAAHDKTHSAEERAGKCGQCGAQFPRWEQLRRHRACAHPPPAPPRAPHACPQCGKGFTHAHSLTRHLHNHAKQLYRCVVCKASFDQADQLANHLNSHLANYRRLKP